MTPNKTQISSFSKLQKQIVIVVCGLVTGMAFVDATALNVALPSIQKSLSATAADAFWVLEIYLLFLAALLMAGGALGDNWGRRRSLRLGVIAFAATSLACALAQDAGQLILFRAAQGIGAALMIPASLAMINASFAPEERGLAIGSWSAVTTLAIPLGPLIGGLAVDFAYWQLIFVINLPISLIVLYLLQKLPRPPFEPEQPAPIDVIGSIIITLALGLLITGLLEAAKEGVFLIWHQLTLGLGAALLFGFFIYEWHAKTPMLPPSLMKKPRFQIVSLQTFILFAGFQGSSLFINFLLIETYGFSAFKAGLVQLPISIMVFFLSRPAGRWVSKYGPRGILVIAGIVIAMAQFSISRYDGGHIWYLLLSMFTLGIGIGLMAAPLTTVAMSAAGPGQDGIASGVNNAVSRIGPLIAVAVLGYWQAVLFLPLLTEAVSDPAIPPFIRDYVLENWRLMSAMPIPADWPAMWQEHMEALLDRVYGTTIKVILVGCASLSLLAGLIAFGYRKTDSQADSTSDA